MATKKTTKTAKPLLNAPDAPFEPMFPTGEVDLDAVSDRVTPEMTAKLAGAARGNKPDISGLPDAIADGRPLFKVGDKIVIEQYATILETNPYLHTRTYKVMAINPQTGDLKLWDESLCQWGMDNYVKGPMFGQVYKLADGVVIGKRKRGRPRKNPVAPVVVTTEKPTGEKKGRGRPKGSKNRPKDVIAAERKVVAEARRARKAKAAKRAAVKAVSATTAAKKKTAAAGKKTAAAKKAR